MRWIVFDYGGVISRPTRALPKLAASLGVPAESFTAAYWEFRDAYDRGMPDVEYWGSIGSRVGVEVDADQAATLTDADIDGWLEIDPQVPPLLDELDMAGFDLALLSNAASAHGRAFERQSWAGRFRHLVISGDLGMAKPDADIWRALVHRLDTEPDDCLFFDDKQANIDGARAAGLHAHRWLDTATARDVLAGLGIL